ncbi:hypothetical protein CORT_0A01570 [Candida orthopsilosis Co 90-125]|uniref:Membrane transporter n=1 Tax=Candida orthopsilosis (strain 90-125) TaxID=1136231 RepID=H8WVS5_CANO9|nr:hypothetical protein CORT_0A01570 [Candida orthopsilosis Co 90-125]CCG20548.1 hypothetical protein CORT_0A01570 [Candida orthopsilosis Co 90-125]
METTTAANELNSLLESEVVEGYTEAAHDNGNSIESDEDEELTWIREHAESHKQTCWVTRPSMFQLCFILVGFTLAMSMTEGTRRIVLVKLACNSSLDSKGFCSPVNTQLILSSFDQYGLFGSTILSFAAISKFGLSDIYGRKPFLVAAVLSFTVSNCLSFYFYHFETFEFGWLLASTILSAVGGGYMMIGTIVNTCVVDLNSKPSQRANALARVSAFTNGGQFLGPIIGTQLSAWAKTAYDANPGKQIHITGITQSSKILKSEFFLFKLELVIEIALCFFVVFVFSETRTPKALARSRANSVTTRSSSEASENGIINKVGTVFAPLKALLHGTGKVKVMVISLTLVIVFDQVLMIGFSQVILNWVVFKFDFEATDISYLLSIFSISRVVSLLLLLPFFQTTVLKGWLKFKVLKSRLDMIDFILIVMALIVDVGVFGILYLARSKTDVYASLSLWSSASWTVPVLIAAVLKYFPTSKVGEFYSAQALLQNILMVIGPLVIVDIYKWSLKKNWDSFIFLLYGVFMAMFVAVMFTCKAVSGLKSSTEEERAVRRATSVNFAEVLADDA